MDKQKLLTYECPTISEYISVDWMQTIIARYVAWKVNKKIRRYNKRIERMKFLKYHQSNLLSNN
jgi:hypothetical protein